MQTASQPTPKVILRKGGAKAPPARKLGASPVLGMPYNFKNPVFKNMDGKKFYLFPVMGSHVCT